MRGTDQPEGEVTVAVDSGVECPLCQDEIRTPIEEHLLERHTQEELAGLVTRFVMERDETGTVR